MAVDARCHLRSQLSCWPDFCVWPLSVAALVMNISLIDYLGFFNKVIAAFQGLPWWLSGEESACDVGDVGSVLSWEDPLVEGMATHSSILAWRNPWTEKPGGLQSMGSQIFEQD